MSYEWDPAKAARNLLKHGIDFADAVAVLEDERALWREDTGDWEEDRYVVVGLDHLGRVLVVVFTTRGDLIRLISARPSTKIERSQYDQ